MRRSVFTPARKILRSAMALAAVAALDVAPRLNAANVSLTTSDANGATTSFNGAGHWNNSQAPSAANDYFTAGYLLRTPDTGTTNYFPGNSLTLDDNATNGLVGLSLKYPSSGGVLVPNLKLNGGAIFDGQGATMSVSGNITVLTNSFLDPQAASRILAIYAPISGGNTNTIGLRAYAGTAGGVVQLLGDNSGYAGNWRIWGTGDSSPAAVLQIGNGGASGNLGSGSVMDDNSLVFDRSDNITVGNVISGPGSVTQAGPGTLMLTGTNTYTGSTSISAGTLALGATGSVAASPAISLVAGSSLDVSAVGGFGLAPGQSLTGSGSVVGAVASVAGGNISPGGTLTFNGNLNLGNSSLGCNLSTPNVAGGVNSLLVVNGNLTLTPGITVNPVFPGGVPIAGTYTLCQCTGTLTGAASDFTTSLGSPVSFAANTSVSPATVTMTVGGSNTVQIIKVYLQGGQSNADGRAVTNGLPINLLQPQIGVPFYYYLTGGAANSDGTLGTLTTLRPGCSAIGGGTTFGPEITFGNGLAAYYAVSNGVPNTTAMVALIKYAHGGTSLVSDWAATGNSATNGDGPDYLIFQQVARTGLARLAAAYPAASIELDGMIWVQGETDIDDGVGSSTAYGTNLIRFINDVRLKFATNRPYGLNLPFFFSRISAQQTYYSLPSDASYANYLLLRAGQNYAAATMASSNVVMLNIDGSQFSTLTPYANPGLHFDTGGQQALGTAFAESVRMALPPSWLHAPVKSGNGWDVFFTGVTGTTHSVQRANAVTGPWTQLTNLLVNPSGATNFNDPNPPGAAGFYRTSRP